jgi:nitrogen fixation/metabolism regulation signal transduction histidine kinase
VTWEQRRQIDDHTKKEGKVSEQFERIIEQLKNQIKEKEVEKNSLEVKEQYHK